VGLLRGKREVVVACLGMGLEMAGQGAEIILEHFRLRGFVFGGYGGALVPQLHVGEVVVAENFTTDAILNFIRLLADFQYARICSSDELVITPERRQQFAEATHCQVVDMETAAVAEKVHGREVPFLAVRSISDAFDSRPPGEALAAAFDRKTLRPRPVRLALRLAAHPYEIGRMREFVRMLPMARAGLTRFLLQLDSELPSGW
jgi:adenosylhomocysteine nucleosidase